MTKLTNHQLSVAFAHIQKSTSPETKNPIALLAEIGQKLHVAPIYFISKSTESETLNFYKCDICFPGYQANASSRYKKISKKEAAKALLDQIVSDAKRSIMTATEQRDAKLKASKRGPAENPQLQYGKRQRMLPESTSSQQSVSQPSFQFQGQIHYIQSQNQCARACKDIMERSIKPVICGFDIEWRPHFRKGINNKTAVIQLCPSEEDCYIFHISFIRCIPTALKCLIEDKDIIKAGIGIKPDMKKIYSDFGLTLAGAVDLSQMYKRVNGSEMYTREWGLKSLVEEVLQECFVKNKRATMSNWEGQLTREQLMYAATDAYAGFMLYRKIKEMQGPTETRIGSSFLGVSTSGGLNRKRSFGSMTGYSEASTGGGASSQGSYSVREFSAERGQKSKRSYSEASTSRQTSSQGSYTMREFLADAEKRAKMEEKL